MLVIIGLVVLVVLGILWLTYKVDASGPSSVGVLVMIGTFGGAIALVFIFVSIGTTRSMDNSRILERRELAQRFEYMKKGEPMEEIRKAGTLLSVNNWNDWLFEVKRDNKVWDLWHPDEVETLEEIK